MGDRDPVTGRFLRGHAPLSGGGRPLGVANKITRSLREQVVEGLGDIPTFVKHLKTSSPPSAAALLVRMMPPGDAESDRPAAAPITINIMPVAAGSFLVNTEKVQLVSEASAKLLADFSPDGSPKPMFDPFGLDLPPAPEPDDDAE